MLYLSQMLGEPVVIDANGEEIGSIFSPCHPNRRSIPCASPRLRSWCPGKTPFMISWRKYVKDVTDDGIELKVDKASASASATFSPMRFCSRAICLTARSSTRRV